MKRHCLVAAVCLIALLSGCATTGLLQHATPTGFVSKVMTVGGKEMVYSVYVPRDYTEAKEWPLVIFLHGAGERGSDGLIQTDVGLGHAIRTNPDRFPCIVVMPQCPKESSWPQRHDIIDEALARGLADYHIDKHRVYLTGLSMGGYGTWSYGAEHADVFAALLPICGGGKTSDAAALAKVPIRVFHGGSDSVVKVENSRTMVEAVKAAGGVIDYTEYPGVDHNSWDQTYGDPEVIKWLLAQKKK